MHVKYILYLFYLTDITRDPTSFINNLLKSTFLLAGQGSFEMYFKIFKTSINLIGKLTFDNLGHVRQIYDILQKQQKSVLSKNPF